MRGVLRGRHRWKQQQRFICGVVLLSLATAGAASPGSEKTHASRPAPRWAAGLAAMYKQSPYLGQRDKQWIFPALRYRGPRFFLFGPYAGIRLAQTGPIRMNGIARVRFSPFDADDSEELAGLASRPTTVEAGLQVAAFLPRGLRASTSVTADLLNRHSGLEAEITLSRPIRRKAWVCTPSLDVRYESKELTHYFFGVRNPETAPGRPAYTPGAAWSTGAHLTTRRKIGDAWIAMLGIGITRLGDPIVRSPIIERRTVFHAIAHVAYSF